MWEPGAPAQWRDKGNPQDDGKGSPSFKGQPIKVRAGQKAPKEILEENGTDS